ncbi:MAG: penicillin-binding transpeptidase domain-containing protein, partial [Turneriella sp.]
RVQKMGKIRARVNRILKSAVVLSWAILAPERLFAANRGHLLAETNGAGYKIISRSGADLLAPVGSLLKPFAALYLLENGVNAAQEIFCPPERKRSAALRCWTPEGHGAMTMGKALVQSCNYYFLSQFRGRNLGAYETWLRQRYDWPENLHITKPVNVYGFDLEFGIEAETLMRMYSRLLNESAAGNRHAVTVTGALKEICQGTLNDFCRELAKQPQYRLVLGKTGTVQEGKRNFGVVFLLVDHVPQGKDFC